MIILYYVAAVITGVVGIGSIFWLRRKWSKIPFRKGLKYSDLAGVDIYKLFGSLRTSFDKKKSAILIKLAQKGLIRIREADGTYYIDKLSDFEAGGKYAEEILSKVFAENVSYVGDEGAIMSFESVSWNDAKKRYRETVQEIIEENTISNKNAGKPKGRKIRVRKNHSWAELAIIVFWLAGLFPVSVAYAFDENVELALAVLATYVTIGLCLIIVNGCFVVGRILFKACKKLSDAWEDKAVLSLLIYLGGWIIRLIFGLGGCISLFACFSIYVAFGWTGPGLNLNPWIGAFMVIITIILICMKLKRQKAEETYPENGYLSHEVLVQSLLDKKNVTGLIVDKDKYNSIMPFAYMYDKTDALEGLKIQDKDEKPDWYEGENWISMNKLMSDLDSEEVLVTK